MLLNYLLPADVVRLCSQHRVTGLTCVPPLWVQIAGQDWPAEAAGHLRYFANTGGRMPKATLDRLRALFWRAKPFLMYGLTEAFRSTYLDPAEVDRRPDSIGKAIPNAEVLVVRPDGSLCGPGERGELVHRGALVAMGYWNDPEHTAERFRPAPAREPGLCTEEMAVWSGDEVVRDEEGFLYFVGRKDEMIKTSGYRLSPTEIEEVAYDTGLVRDAVALGVDDADLGQYVVLVVSPMTGDTVDVDALLAQMRKALPPLHAAEEGRCEARDPPLAKRQVRPLPVAQGADDMMPHSTVASFATRSGSLCVGGLPVDVLAERVGETPFFAYDRSLLTRRVAELRAALPSGIHLSYAMKANPMPAVVHHLCGLVDSFDVASALELRTCPCR